MYVGVLFLCIGLTSCSDDDDNGVIVPPSPTGSIVVEDQVISGNTLVVDQVVVSNTEGDAWLVARHASQTGAILAQEPLDERTHTNVELVLDDEGTGVDLQDGDSVILMLYADDGDGVFDAADDTLLTDSAGNPIMETVVVSSPSFDIEDQTVQDNSVVITNVNTTRPGWIILYNEIEDGSIDEDDIIGRAYVEAGTTDEVVVPFDDDFTYTPGQNIYSRLHVDDPADELFSFETDPTQDMPENFGFSTANLIETRITVQ